VSDTALPALRHTIALTPPPPPHIPPPHTLTAPVHYGMAGVRRERERGWGGVLNFQPLRVVFNLSRVGSELPDDGDKVQLDPKEPSGDVQSFSVIRSSNPDVSFFL